MINLVLTNTIDSNFILKKLKQNYTRGEKHLVIVPDRIVLSYEMLVYDYLDIAGSFDIEVVSFSRLADLILAKNAKTMLNKQTEIMLIRKVIEDNKDKLRYYKNAANKIGFAEEILKIISAIRQNGISVDNVENLASQIPVKFKNKTEDILFIYRMYIKKLQDSTLDSISKIEALAQAFKDSIYANYNIYISEFMSFSQIELDVIKEFIKFAPQVFVGLPYSKEDNSHIFPNEFVRRFEAIAAECEQRIVIEHDDEKLDIEFEAIRKNLFNYKKICGKIIDPKVEIYEVADQEKEIKNLAISIKRLIKEKKIRYKDIACVCCDLKGYYSTIQAVFSKYEIPYYMDIKTMLVNQVLAKLLLSAIKIVSDGYLQQDVFAFMSEATMFFTKDDILSFENYCLKYGIEFKDRFKKDFLFGDEKLSQKMMKIQQKFLSILKPLENNKNNDTLSHVKVIRTFLESINASALCEDFAALQEKNGYKVEASATRQSFRKIQDILDQMEKILSDCVMDFNQFNKILETTITSQEISTVPMYIDCVYIGDCDKSRYEKKKYIFILGANDSLFPNEKSAAGLLSQQEYVEWNKNGYPLYPNATQINMNERLNALMVMLKPKDGLVISFPKYDMLGNQLMPSNIVGYLQDILGISINKYAQISEKDSIVDIAKTLVSRKSALVELIELKNRITFNEVQYNNIIASLINVLYKISCDDYGKSRVDKILNNGYALEEVINVEDYNAFKSDSISVSRLERYFECPFKFFANYILGLKERETAGVNVKDTGTILHAIMEQYFDKYYKTKDLNKIDEIVEKIFTELTEKERDYLYLLDEEYILVKNNLLKLASSSISTLLIKMQKTKFEPYDMEARFGFEDSKYAGLKINCKDRVLNLNGVIDRIDKYEDKFLVIDYKSKSSIDFKDRNIYYGQRIQLLVYIDVLMKSENLTPAGMYYLLIQNSIKSKEDAQKRLKYIGFTNIEDSVIDAIDENYKINDVYKSDLYPVNKKDNKLSGIDNGSVIENAQKFEKYCNYIEKLITKAANEMQEGYIAASPLNMENTCKYCTYKNLCGINTKSEKERKLANKDNIKFNEILKEM